LQEAVQSDRLYLSILQETEVIMMHWGYGWGMGFGWVFMIFFWVLVILGVVYVIKSVMPGAKKEKAGETALDILKKRYAKGEITKEEFERIKNDLNAS
jgi:putative membrane protein